MKQNEASHFESLYPAETREKEIGEIIGFVKKGLSSQLIGLPGSGKSNVLNLLTYNRKVRTLHLGNAQNKYHFVYMDFSEIKGRNNFEVIKFILISLAYSLSERRMNKEYGEINKYLKEAISFNDELILFQALKKSIDFLANELDLTVILLLDRFDQYFYDVSDSFFLNLKILRNRAKYKFSTVFSLSRSIQELLEEDVYSEFSEFFSQNKVFLSLFDKIGIAFRLSYLDKTTNKKTSEMTKKELLRITSGHGKLTRVGYELLLSEKEISDIENFLEQKDIIKKVCYEIWDTLTPAEQNILIKISKKEDIKIPNYFEEIELIKNGEIYIPIFEKFLSKVKFKNELIVYDEGKNEILKGQDNLTDVLTPLEFRVLRFLIINKDRTCEKEEIINSVWKDSKTQEGVSDQALDQIAYRLRKKIENDPNNPNYILTIKGRGFKFNP